MKREEVNKVIDEASNQILSFNWSNDSFYDNWLAQTYFFVRHSTKLLNLSACHLNHDQENLYARFVEHISEELFHEKLVLQDLKRRKSRIENFEELTATKNFYRSQYFLINQNPTSLLGYILFLEAIAITAGSKVAAITEKCHGVSSFLRVHVEEDVDHIEKAFEAIKSLETNDSEEAFTNFLDTAKSYIQILNEINSKTQKLQAVA